MVTYGIYHNLLTYMNYLDLDTNRWSKENGTMYEIESYKYFRIFL